MRWLKIVRARCENGVLRPLERLDPEEGGGGDIGSTLGVSRARWGMLRLGRMLIEFSENVESAG